MSDEFRLNAYATNGQYGVDVAALANGGFVAVWTDDTQDGDGVAGSDGVYARVFRDDGTPRGREFRVHQGTLGDQGVAGVAALADGGFAVSWSSDGPNARGAEDPFYESYFRVFGPQGGPRTPDVQFTRSNTIDHFASDIEALANGAFVVVSHSSDVSTNWEIASVRATPGGRQVGERAILEPSSYNGTASLFANSSPGVEIAAQPNGRYVMTRWEQVRGGGSVVDRVFARVFDPDGAPAGPKRAVSAFSTTQDRSFPHVAALEDGRFAVIWTGESSRGNDVYFRILDRNGAPATPERLVNGGDRADGQSASDVVHLGGGLTLVTYASYNDAASPTGFDFVDIRGRVFGADGQPLSRVLTFSAEPRNDQGGAQAAILASGDLIVAWQRGGTLNEDVLGRIVDLGSTQTSDGAGDVMRGTLLRERFVARGGDDLIRADAGDDRLYGGAGDDRLIGEAGDDRLLGGVGRDTLDGGPGDDVLWGGAGVDRFVFARGGDRDTVADFAGRDRIDLRDFDLSPRDLRDALEVRGDDVRIDLGRGDRLTVLDVALATLDDAFLI